MYIPAYFELLLYRSSCILIKVQGLYFASLTDWEHETLIGINLNSGDTGVKATIHRLNTTACDILSPISSN